MANLLILTVNSRAEDIEVDKIFLVTSVITAGQEPNSINLFVA